MTLIPTFAQFVQSDVVQKPLGSRGTEHIWAVYNDLIHRRVQEILDDPVVVASGARGVADEWIATGLLEAVFDEDWVVKTFPRADERESDKQAAAWQGYRRRELARRVYEFQSHPWFQDFVEYTKTNEVTSALFEADVLQTLMRLPGGVARGTATGPKGENFDVHLELAATGLVPVEVKCKQDDTPYSASTIRNTARDAIEQLPKGKVGWLFMQLPAAWIGPRLEEEYPDILHEALRQTSRVGAVFTAIDRPHYDPARGTFRLTRGWHFFGHPRAPQPLRDAALLLKQLLDEDMDYFAPHAPF
ncbi:hypothetical protein [Kitasatospora griseola]|uniref:hypothetical protein n=1 Tax=Kitasatospora griseola TaxID=2064 RepID=UPI0034365AFD